MGKLFLLGMTLLCVTATAFAVEDTTSTCFSTLDIKVDLISRIPCDGCSVHLSGRLHPPEFDHPGI